MNRHLIDYAALPCELLGTPIRKQAEKPSPETPWKPIPGHPNHVERINAQGTREVTHKDWVPAPPPPAEPAASGITPLAPSQSVSAESEPWPDGATHRVTGGGNFYRHIRTGETYIWNGIEWQGTACRWSDEEMAGGSFERRPAAAPTEWQSGPPPSKGWWPSFCAEVNTGRENRARYFNGEKWSCFVFFSDSMEEKLKCRKGGGLSVDEVEWRGPRLTGEAWPEPQQ